MIPPPVPAKQGSKPPITQKQFQQLEKFIDGFSLMTYDYNLHNAPGPNAPLHWVKKNLELLKPSRYLSESSWLQLKPQHYQRTLGKHHLFSPRMSSAVPFVRSELTATTASAFPLNMLQGK